MMYVKSYVDAVGFLADTQAALEAEEPANSLLLGSAMRLARYPQRTSAPPCLKLVCDAEVPALAALWARPRPLAVCGFGPCDPGADADAVPDSTLAAAARALAQDLAREAWPLTGVRGPRHISRAVAAAWSESTGQASHFVQRTIAHELRRVLAPPPARGALRQATAGDLPLLARWVYGFDMDAHGQADWDEAAEVAALRVADGEVYLWVDEQPLSMAVTNRPTRRGISISGVYTPPERRRRGYASALVAELSRMLLASGYAFCALFADVENPTANHIYRAMGYRPLCAYDEYAFDHP